MDSKKKEALISQISREIASDMKKALIKAAKGNIDEANRMAEKTAQGISESRLDFARLAIKVECIVALEPYPEESVNEWVEEIKYVDAPTWSAGGIAATKQEYFTWTQYRCLPHCFIVPFSSLADHPLWIPADERADFRSNQVIQDGEIIDINVVVEG